MLLYPRFGLSPDDPHAHFAHLDPETLVDLHVHTTVSGCGYTTPRRLVEAALAAGVRVLAVTDHDSAQGGVLAREAARELAGGRLLVIPGMELSVGGVGHVIVFGRGVEQDWGWRPGSELPLLPDYWAAVLAHPLRALLRRPEPDEMPPKDGDDGTDLILALPAVPPPRIDAVEVINGGDVVNRFARRPGGALSLMQTFAREWQVPGVAGSDGHSLAWTGSIRTRFARPVRSADDLVDQLRGGEVAPGPLPAEALAATQERLDLHLVLRTHAEGRDLAPVAAARGWSLARARRAVERATAATRLLQSLPSGDGVLHKMAEALGTTPGRLHDHLAILDELYDCAAWRRAPLSLSGPRTPPGPPGGRARPPRARSASAR